MIADKFGYAVTYNLCGAGLIAALLVYFACRGMVGEKYGSEPDHKTATSFRTVAILPAPSLAISPSLRPG